MTAHFTLKEFGLPPAGRALRAGFAPAAYPAPWVEPRLKLLCEALEILRAELGGRPVRILSGYRPKEYNSAIGGAARSRHIEGRAADIVVENTPARVVHDTALRLARSGTMRIGGLGAYPAFTHIDVRNVTRTGPAPRLTRWSGSRKEN